MFADRPYDRDPTFDRFKRYYMESVVSSDQLAPQGSGAPDFGAWEIHARELITLSGVIRGPLLLELAAVHGGLDPHICTPDILDVNDVFDGGLRCLFLTF